ncbi:phosphatidylserine synthase, putative [Ichthyophthirius multifiliis]|uniref:Phosphatidylserine synthase, putative n=1 Tax=Ichthyophthirius multifiliis TaxID=5932 RepID=G0QKX0_ICHMU|nr:phosphatidylserine synthase, putative [Ichthyophthirius multifiliis]EGR34121.1 phosphatidylserine synthase, putative [Ichthyophthirius multifiliis]|eukprot:XP_004039425.1 phosphatidylserine synthase, putative [Ichthyophthirius multifiliis]
MNRFCLIVRCKQTKNSTILKIKQIQRGFVCSMLFIVAYLTIFLPNTLLTRPHPAIWRMLQALGICWLICVVFALFMNRDDLQYFLKKFVDENLGKPLPEKNYAENCQIYTPDNPRGPFANVIDSIDVFFTAHFIGWLVKMFICRDFLMCMIQSVLFEFLELSLKHWLPNFAECWWDSVFFDILICNTGGIVVGWYLMNKFQMKEYRWSLQSKYKKSFTQNLKEIFITPNLEKHEWKMFSSLRRFILVMWFGIFMNLVDLNFFFNKFVIRIEPSHYILSYRTFVIGFLSIPASREYYEYISNDNLKRLGGTVWLMQAIIFSEIFLFFKNYQGQFREPFPLWVIIVWTLIIGLFLFVIIILGWRDIKRIFIQNKIKKN